MIADTHSSNDNFVARGIDIWNGSTSLVQGFQAQTGISYPLLQQGSYIGTHPTQFAADRDFYFVIDQNGIIQYRSPGLYGNRFNPSAINAKIAELLASPVAPSTWGRIKALYRR